MSRITLFGIVFFIAFIFSVAQIEASTKIAVTEPEMFGILACFLKFLPKIAINITIFFRGRVPRAPTSARKTILKNVRVILFQSEKIAPILLLRKFKTTPRIVRSIVYTPATQRQVVSPETLFAVMPM